MKLFYKRAIPFFVSAIILLSAASPAYAAAPHKSFQVDTEGLVEFTQRTRPIEITIPKYIGAFTTTMKFYSTTQDMQEGAGKTFTDDTFDYSQEVKIAVVRANPVTGGDQKLDSVQGLRDSIVQVLRAPSGQTVDTFTDTNIPIPVDTYVWNDTKKGFDNVINPQIYRSRYRHGDGISVQFCETSGCFVSSVLYVDCKDQSNPENIDSISASGGIRTNFSPGFDFFLPLTEEQETEFLATGKINGQDWSSGIDLSGLRTVLTNPEAAPPVDISLNLSVAKTFPAEPATSVIRIVELDDKEYSFYTYHIKGKNYYKLNDMMAALNGTSHQMDIVFNPKINKWERVDRPYALTGTEFQAGDGTVKTAEAVLVPFNAINYDGHEVLYLYEGYKIDGEYYFDLAALSRMLKFTHFKGEYPKNEWPKIEAGKPDGIRRIY